MAFELRYAREAVQQLKELRPFERAAIVDQIEKVLGVNPELEGKSKVKRLRQPAPCQYRFRFGDFRIYYDVEHEVVSIIQILSKEASIAYLGR